MEQYLETNLAAIAARTAGAELESHVALVRENREMVYGLLIAAGAVLLLCFAICAGMINNALSARIRAGRRQIGTLRAVGASERTITRSYRWQLLSAFAWGTITGLAVGLTLCGGLLWKGIVGDDALSPVSYTHLDVYKRQSLKCALYALSDRLSFCRFFCVDFWV